jgi:hypothetical protein
MIEELEKIDTSAIEELGTIKQEQELLGERLHHMEERKEEVSDVVFTRVRRDYESRLNELDDQARPLKERARQEYATLRGLFERLQSALEAARLDKEEAEFRHELGEFTDSEFGAREKELESHLTQQQADLAEVEKLKQRFIQAFRSEEELEQAGETEPQPPAEHHEPPDFELDHHPAPASATVPIDSPEVTEAGTGEVAATLEAPAVPDLPLPPAGTESGATVIIRGPALTTQAEDGSLEEYSLGREVTSIGRSPDNDIRIPKSSVSRRHAKIVLETEGYRMVDLGSENGTYVNGERITECLLRNGDMVQVGPVAFVFTQS